MTELKCPKCESKMIPGYLLEKSMLEADMTPTEWVAIESEYFEKYGFFQKKHITDRRRVETYCCTECGFLESFAVKPQQ